MMGQFLTKLRTEKLTEAMGIFGRAEFMVIHALRFRSLVLNMILTVPAGFTTDFASVPRFGIVYALFGDRGHASATVHDYLLVTGMVDRSTADLVFAEALRAEGVVWGLRHFMYAGVRVGTLIAWLQGRA